MRNLLLVLSAAVLAGLSIYVVFTLLGWIGLLGSDVLINVNAFVALVACLTVGGAAAVLALQAVVVRLETRTMAQLEQRIAALEQRAQGR